MNGKRKREYTFEDIEKEEEVIKTIQDKLTVYLIILINNTIIIE